MSRLLELFHQGVRRARRPHWMSDVFLTMTSETSATMSNGTVRHFKDVDHDDFIPYEESLEKTYASEEDDADTVVDAAILAGALDTDSNTDLNTAPPDDSFVGGGGSSGGAGASGDWTDDTSGTSDGDSSSSDDSSSDDSSLDSSSSDSSSDA